MNNVLFLLLLLPTYCWLRDNTKNYEVGKDGIELTAGNFKSTVLDQPGYWLVIFDGDMKMVDCAVKQKVVCESVKGQVKFYKDAFKGLQDAGFKIGIVDYTDQENNKLKDDYHITGFPEYYIFGKHKDHPIHFNYQADSAQYIVDKVKFLNDEPLPAMGQCGKDSGPTPGKSTYELNDDNFNQAVLQCSDSWVVTFYAPGFPSCEEFLKHYEEAAKALQGKAKFGVFYMGLSKLANVYDPQHVVCMAKFYGRDKSKPIDYNNGTVGPGFNEHLVEWVKSKLEP